jgi:hypothetical protein
MAELEILNLKLQILEQMIKEKERVIAELSEENKELRAKLGQPDPRTLTKGSESERVNLGELSPAELLIFANKLGIKVPRIFPT